MNALQIHLRDIARAVAILRDAVLLLEVVQLFARERQQSFACSV